jgi:hypothetical protein
LESITRLWYKPAMKNIFRLAVTISVAVVLLGCAGTTILHEDATVVSVEKIEEPNHSPSTGTVVGASSGVGAGLLIGGVTGSVLCVSLSVVTLGIAVPACVGIVAASLGIGGGVGLAVGGTTGYLVDRHQAGSGVYEYTVLVQETKKPMTIVQVENTPIEIGRDVQVFLEKDGHAKVEPKEVVSESL